MSGINFKDIQTTSGDGTFEPIEIGRYTVMVDDATITKSQSNNDMISVTFVILDNKYKNRKLWDNFVITEKSLPFLKSFLEALKSNLASADNVQLQDIVADIKNKKCTVYVEPGVTNKGNPKSILSKYRPLDPLAENGDTTSTESVSSVGSSPLFK